MNSKFFSKLLGPAGRSPVKSLPQRCTGRVEVGLSCKCEILSRNNTIAFYDFDGTITSRDSFIDFIIYTSGYRKFLTGMLLTLPFLMMYKMKLLPNWKAKEKVITRFFGGWDADVFNAAAIKYSTEKLPLIIRDTAKDTISLHKKNGDHIVVVSASVEQWLAPWCRENDLELIGTQLEVDGNKITGRIKGSNCYGVEKVKRIRESYDLGRYGNVYAYGDSSGDREMLELADIRFYRWKNVK